MRGQEYIVTRNEKKYTVVQVDAATFLVNGVRHTVDCAGTENLFSMIIDNRVFSVAESLIEPANGQSSRDIICFSLDGVEHCVMVDDERSLLRKSMNSHDDPAEKEITICSPMPGLVVKLEVMAGDSVSKEQGLVILEAMKMENELRAPQNGIISSVHVEKGDSVEKGERLLTLKTQ